MKLLPVIAVGTLLVMAAALWAEGDGPVVVPPSVPMVMGRYQLTVLGSPGNIEMVEFDTQTGDVWHRYGSMWTYDGNPTQNPGTKLPAPAARGGVRGGVRGGGASSMPVAPAVPVLPER